MQSFYKQKNVRDGHFNACKTCVIAQVRSYRATHDSVREYDRARSGLAHRVALRAITTQKWRGRFPGKYKAQTKVGNALRDGKLVKGPCEVCGNPEVHGHHDDYRKPLDVRWLCALHHHRHHADSPTFTP